MEKLKVEDIDGLAADYEKRHKYYLKACEVLAQEKLDCLEKSEHPVSGIDFCKVNEGVKSRQKLRAVDVKNYVKAFDPQPLPEGEGARILAAVQGTWVSEWKSGSGTLLYTTTRTIGADGKMEQVTKTESNGKEEKDELAISFGLVDRATILRGTTKQQSVFVLKGDTFYESSNLVYGAFAVPDKGEFAFKIQDEWIFYKQGTCEFVTAYGLVIPGECQLVEEEGKEVFTAKYTIPGKIRRNGKPDERTFKYQYVDGYLMHESLLTSGTFKKQQ